MERDGRFKDAFHDYVVGGADDAVDPGRMGTKAAVHYRLAVPAGGAAVVRLRLCRKRMEKPFLAFDRMLGQRRHEADEFYRELAADEPAASTRTPPPIQRQAFAGMLWSKQFYDYDVPQWLAGDPGQPPPPPERRSGRNHEWFHLNNADVISMPDKWEFPWYAAWDLAFHCVPLAHLDPEFAKDAAGAAHPRVVHAPQRPAPGLRVGPGRRQPAGPRLGGAAGLRDRQGAARPARGGGPDTAFLERVFHKLMLNFTWWVNRKDVEGRNLFQGGFLGLDNIGVFDRSAPLPTGGHIDQADGTSWMAMYSLNLMRMALELARTNPVYQDVATKFFEHFLYIAAALNDLGGQGVGLWDDGRRVLLRRPPPPRRPRRAAQGALDGGADPALRRRGARRRSARPGAGVPPPGWSGSSTTGPTSPAWCRASTSRDGSDRRLLSLLRAFRMKRVIQQMLDESEFLSDYGVRALSRFHREHPYVFVDGSRRFVVDYQPGESTTGLFGGNSNWRGPIWFPFNALIVESLRTFHRYYGDDFQVECPTGSGHMVSLAGAADELARRLVWIFRRGADGRRPVFGDHPLLQDDPHFRDHLLFYECFHGDNGRGVGAAHQTGWTGLVADLLAGVPGR